MRQLESVTKRPPLHFRLGADLTNTHITLHLGLRTQSQSLPIMSNNTVDNYVARAVGILKRIGSAAWPLLVLCIINYATFAAQYEGRATFPWDFLGGYHAQAFGWYDNGGIFNPPSWFPWTNLGFPAFLALQSGAWYLPLQAMHTLGVAYTIHAATLFQVLHVLFGAIGVYLLTRRLGASKAIALVMAIGFHFSAAFYSNQQNVDIVRATAFIPWLLLVLCPTGQSRAHWNILVGTLILSQFLIAGYPGNIVAAAYACAIWVIFLAWAEVTPGNRLRYLANIALIVLAGTLIALLKWLPPILNGHAGISIEHPSPAPFAPSHLLTLMTPYVNNALPSDITMRSLWLPLTCVWGIFYIRSKDRLAQIGVLFAAFALFMGIFARSSALLSEILPGMQFSRFPIADWRPILHIGLIFACVPGWANFISHKYPPGEMTSRSIAAFGLGTIIVLAAIRFGLPADEMFRVIVANSLLAIGTLLYASLAWQHRGSELPANVAATVLMVFTAVGGYQYQMSQPATWRMKWNTNVMLQTFGVDVESLVRHPQPAAHTARRPRRMLLGSNVSEAIAQKDRSLYNRCWYQHSYCVLGYDNLKMSAPYRMFFSALTKPGGYDLLRFAEDPLQLLAMNGVDGDVMNALAAPSSYGDAPLIGNTTGMTLHFLKYSPDLVEYDIHTPRKVRFIANEMWWPGWKISVCGAGETCSAYKDTESTAQGLRTWVLAKGTWRVNLRFFGPSPVPGYISALLGLLLAATGFGFDLWRRRRHAALARLA